MPRMPGALWRPLPHSGARMRQWDILCWHTMVGSLWGTDSYFRGMAPSGTSSHFGTGPDGDIVQWVDTANMAYANRDGSWHIISVETADVGAGFPSWNLNDGSAVPAWTSAQVEAHAQIAVWVQETHNIPFDLIPDSKPGRRGNGFHRQGVPGYMVAGGEQWSSAYGKVCPGARRIAQIPQVLNRARQIVSGAVTEEEDMTDEQAKQLARILTLVERQKTGIPGKQVAGEAGVLQQNELKAARAEIAALRAAIAATKGIDAGTLERIVREAVAETVVTVDVNVAGGQPPSSA